MAKVKSGLQGLPRGAIAIVAFGLLLTALCWGLTNTSIATGERLEWQDSAKIPDSERAPLGETGAIKIHNAEIVATRPNASNFNLYRVSGQLEVSTDDPQRRATAACTVSVPKGVIFARKERRAAFPQPSEDLSQQDVPDFIVVKFSAKGSEDVGVDLGDAFDAYTNTGDIVAEWKAHQIGRQTWTWTIRAGNRQEPLDLGFAIFWRTEGDTAAAKIDCDAETVGGGKADVTTAGKLGLQNLEEG